MNLTFDHLEISGFKTITSTQRLDFAGRGNGLYFMRGRNELEPRLGSNGASKSGIWGALCWCLYGKTPEGLRNPDIKPWGTKLVPEVTLILCKDGKEHTITRRAVTNGLAIDDKEVGAEEAEKLLGLSFELFTNTILLGQGLPLFFDLPNKDKLQLFSDVLNLERWEARSAAASDKTSELVNLQSEMTGELNSTEATLAQTREALVKLEERQSEWETERKARLTNLRSELEQKRKALAPLADRLDVADRAYDRAATEAEALKKSVRKLEQELLAAAQEHNAALTDKRALERTLALTREQLEELKVAKTCPTCGQTVKAADLREHKAELERELKNNEKLLKANEALTLEKSRKTVEGALANERKHLAKFETEAETQLTQLNFLRPQVAELRAQVNSLTSSEGERKDEANPYTEQVQLSRRTIQKLHLAVEALKADLDKAAQRIEQTRFWVKGFKDVRLFVVEDVLQELELTTNAILVDLGLLDWEVAFSIEKETKSGTFQRGLNVIVYSPTNKDPVRWESFSGGESQRLRIAGALALSEVLLARAGVTTNLEILDEPARYMSGSGVADLCDYLKQRARSLGKQIWFIDHLAREGAVFDGVVTVVKDRKGSRIEL